MLVLTRNIGETIVIQTNEGDVEVVILEVKGNQVRLGTKAPESVKIWRSELLKGSAA